MQVQTSKRSVAGRHRDEMVYTFSDFPARTQSNPARKETAMDSITDRASANARRGREEEKREVDFFVRAKTGPGRRDWSSVGVAFKRRNDEPGYSIKLNCLPIDKAWDGTLVLVPPYIEEDETQQD
jgi:hypothetical protein